MSVTKTEADAIVFTRQGEVAFQRAPVLEPGAGELLVRAVRTLISTGTELTCLSGRYEPGSHWDGWVKYPFRPGYCMAGTVIATGEGATRFKTGDRVAARGPHQSVAVVAEENTISIPGGVSNDEACWYGMATIAQNAVRRPRPELGDSVAIIGLGLIGQLLVQYTRLMGARQIFAIDTAPVRLDMATNHGATHPVRRDIVEARAEVMAATDGRGCDVVFDATGAPAVFPSALKLVRELGKIVLVGDSGFPTQQHLTGDLVTRGITVFGAHDGNARFAGTPHMPWTNPVMGDLFLEYLRRGDMRVSDLITHRFRPEQAAEAYATLREHRETALGVVFEWPPV
jgi:2-desacetyl-2-hydroxyethyl bacteriochlorophyllide A dehydrogenase